MSWLPQFAAWQFAFAGLLCAAAPIIIHLLNRRRYRVVHWAAMPFLREALQRNRKIMQMRDIILLILRTAAVLFFGAAIARPFFSASEEEFDRSKPLHAILVVDNSLSMGYSQVEGTLLDKAKDRAKQFVEELPEGSLVTVIPLCGTEQNVSRSAQPYKDKALLADIDSIEVVDRSASMQQAINAATAAEATDAQLASRIVIFTDQQEDNWAGLTTPEQFKNLKPMQVVDVSPADWENTWISDVRIQDGLADVETPTTFIVRLEHRGGDGSTRKDVQVSLYVDGELVASPTVAVDPNAAREVAFEHTFNQYSPEEGLPEFVPVRVAISADALMADNERHVMVPVVASLPVLFIDQYRDDEEDPATSRLGETRRLRRLLAPTAGRDEVARQLIKVKHITIDELTQADLEDARLVVIGGVESPGSEANVKLLRDYVRQGGQLVIGAGGQFDPADWTELAWLDGGGILPAPLAEEPVGQLPEEATRLDPLFLAPESFADHSYFRTREQDKNSLADIYSYPLFFRYVEATVTPEVSEKLREAELKRLEQEYADLAEAQKVQREFDPQRAELDESSRQKLADAEARIAELRPKWLRWKQKLPQDEVQLPDELPADANLRDKTLDRLAANSLPQVQARFTTKTGPAFIVERRVGRGNVMLVTSSFSSGWNTLPRTNAMFVYDRILRSLIHSTLPPRNETASEQAITLPLPTDEGELEISLKRPGREDDPEPLAREAISAEQFGVTIQKPLARGLYEVTALRPSLSAEKAASDEAWQIQFVVNGDAAESNLTPLSRDAFDERAGDSQVRLVSAGDSISLAGAQISGQNLWRWGVLLVLILLLAEIAILAWPAVKARVEEPAVQT